ncbi:hypothetical protein E3Q17_00388 [Wallemia mellicola]|uniref:RRM domain-containing protein n=1 Tax=Wallemia mellicola TaxID=1708541 RepID=A0A4T0P5K0_9BASI|nr:hypothetical protein E3Q17_00388 [Wallemia mellicola]
MPDPNTTLYLRNLPDKINKQELRSQLYFRFQSYGRILDVVALKTDKLRGQAWIVFDVLSSATSAMRAENGNSESLFSDAQKAAQGGIQRMVVSNVSEASLGLKRAREAEELARSSENDKRIRTEE